MNFDGFYGNDRAKAYLNSAFARNALPHALLITGERGIGKKTLAGIIARTLVCDSANAPCGVCDSCYKSERGIHPDIIQLGSDDETVKVEEIRALKRNALLRPNDSERKVYILNHAESMTHQAQDAFLKILEEPPLFTFFIILCYNLSDLLPTIISRTASIALSPLSDSDMRTLLFEKLPNVSEEEREKLISTSNGICSFLTEEKNAESTDIAVNIAKALTTFDELSILKALTILEKHDRYAISDILDELVIILRDACVISSGAEIAMISRADSSVSSSLAKAFSPKECCAVIDRLNDARNACVRNIGVLHITGSLICKLADIAANAALKG